MTTTFIDLVILITTVTGMSNSDATELLTNYCENKMYAPKTEAVTEICTPVWDNFDNSYFPNY